MNRVIVFGATGYQGGLTAQALVSRGLSPVLAGRNEQWLRALAIELGGLDYAVADLSDPASLRQLLAKGDVLITTVGPFSRHGLIQVEQAVAAGAHYLDSCGEGAYYRLLHERFGGARANGIGSALLTGCAYDFFPGNAVADHVLHKAGPEAVRVDIGYFGETARGYQMSAGSMASGVFTMLEPGLIYRDRRHVAEGIGCRLGHVALDGEDRPGLSVAGTEHLFLPPLHPQLRDIHAYWGWAGQRSYALKWVMRGTAAVARVKPVKHGLNRLLARMATSDGSGPDANLRQRSSAYVSAAAFDAAGRKLASAQMGDIDGFSFTANILAWTAHAIVRGQLQQTGFTGPVQAFGRENLLRGHAEAGFELS